MRISRPRLPRRRRWLDAGRIRDGLGSPRIRSDASGTGRRSTPGDDWVAPAFWDIQINGRWGHSFSSPDLTVEQVVAIVRARARWERPGSVPTLITAPVEHMLHGLRTIAAACDSVCRRRRAGGRASTSRARSSRSATAIAVPTRRRRSATPTGACSSDSRRPRAAGSCSMTLAPERPGAIDSFDRATAAGVVIALGHTAADGATIQAAVEPAPRLSTHLGNGIASSCPGIPTRSGSRPPRLSSWPRSSPTATTSTWRRLRVLARAKGPSRLILVSDASPLAGLPPGIYGEWAVDPRARSSWPARLIWPARTRGSKSVCKPVGRDGLDARARPLTP